MVVDWAGRVPKRSLTSGVDDVENGLANRRSAAACKAGSVGGFEGAGLTPEAPNIASAAESEALGLDERQLSKGDGPGGMLPELCIL